MSVEPVLASRGLADQEDSAIRLVPLPDLWPPPDESLLAASWPDRPGGAPPPLPDLGPVLPRQFAAFLVEGLAGLRPARQLMPWLSERGRVHLHRLMPLFGGHQPRVLRVLTARPSPDVIEMTMVVVTGPRTRAVAVRLERAPLSARKATPPWLCTDIEAA